MRRRVFVSGVILTGVGVPLLAGVGVEVVGGEDALAARDEG